ncbi:ion channel [Pontibacter rugosus]|uniref:Ion channel n=1 Tax=Pontibacter rugosus TaxID=1745966 RepID=A0ABW3SJ20_9BACT
MNVLYLCLGVVLFAFTILDIVKTALSSNGGGLITNQVTRAVWKAFFLASGKNGRSQLIRYAGPAILLSILFTWIMALWGGLFLVLLYEAGSIVNSKTMASASVLEKLYYAGFTLSTLGVGDFIASGIVWRIVTDVAAFAGLVFITTSITYFVPVLSAVSLQSKLSLYINGMGKTPQQILINSWNGKDFSAFFGNASDLCQLLMHHTLNHHSYPVIHYFHNNQPDRSIAPSVALLHEAYQLLANAVPKEAVGNQLMMSMLGTALNAYLETVKGSFLKNPSPKEIAPTPDLRELEEKGVPLKDRDKARHTFEVDLQERRKVMTAILEMDGWTWQDVYTTTD